MDVAPIISFENVSVSFGDERVYDRLSFDVWRGEFVCIQCNPTVSKTGVPGVRGAVLLEPDANERRLAGSASSREDHQARQHGNLEFGGKMLGSR